MSTYADFCQAFNQKACAEALRCGFSAPTVDCSAEGSRFTYDCTRSTDRYTYSPAMAAACLGSLDGGDCGAAALLTVEGNGAFVGPCNQVLEGAVPLDGGCAGPEQCAPQSDGGLIDCVAALGSCEGVCTAFAATGQSCSLVPCANGTCDATQHCVAWTPEGGDCTSNPCSLKVDFCDPRTSPPSCSARLLQGQWAAAADWCSLSTAFIAGTDGGVCEPLSGDGGPCDDAARHLCAPPLNCIQVGPSTSICSPSFSNIYCDANQGCDVGGCELSTNTCVPGALAGDACDPSHPCAYTAFCDGGVCQPAGAEGSSCVFDCQIGLVCSMGVCRAPSATCAPFPSGSPYMQCAFGYCDATGSCQPWVPDGSFCDSTLNLQVSSACGPDAFCNPYPDGGGFCVAGCGY